MMRMSDWQRQCATDLKKYIPYARAGWRKLLDLLYPPRCPVCDQIVKMGEGRICKSCKSRLQVLQEPLCRKCGKPLADETGEYCTDCLHHRHNFDEGIALYEYHTVRDAIYRFKYLGRQEYKIYFGEEMARELGAKIKGWKPDALIPVPIHTSRRRERGYNQAELLAKELGRHLSIPVYSDYVVRTRQTAPQKALNAAQRQNNLKKAFKIARNDVKLKTIIIIDDIYTTGCTIDEIAEVCRRAGAERVCFVVLAVGSSL